jgi:hypothetical protein
MTPPPPLSVLADACGCLCDGLPQEPEYDTMPFLFLQVSGAFGYLCDSLAQEPSV